MIDIHALGPAAMLAAGLMLAMADLYLRRWADNSESGKASIDRRR